MREVFKEGYRFDHFIKDLLAGLTVGIIAIPLSMALAIASGVPPQYGLYTAIIAGILIPLTGGSRYSVSGPTAAFVVILYPVAQSYGLNGLLLATLLAGLIMLTLAFARLGRLIEYIPEPVTLGFTSGIAVVIAVLQLNDFLGLHIAEMPEFFFAKLVTLFDHLPAIHTGELVVGVVTLASLIIWPKFKTPIPTYLPAAIVGTLAAFLWGFNEIETSCFSLTVIFDMVIAICVGVVLAALLFMRDIAQMTQVKDISGVRKHVPRPLSERTAVYKINGPLFFAAADRVFDQLEHLSQGKQKIILYLDGVSILDAGGLSALERFIERRIQDGCEIVLADLQFQPLKTVSRSDLTPLPNQLSFTATLAEALDLIEFTT
ncbi:SulP family inorganic anion transporter [Marinobacterium sp. xm-d-579]|uniref:SulP family inorganic anion transporter n=1 Tax=Marinobacterium sp. xm-d-579 TaxID=2497734 RepID=UPI001C2BF6C0|nr:SulP family inorganic anion transporter [Marinobacterium sp. xm-d-579]